MSDESYGAFMLVGDFPIIIMTWKHDFRAYLDLLSLGRLWSISKKVFEKKWKKKFFFPNRMPYSYATVVVRLRYSDVTAILRIYARLYTRIYACMPVGVRIYVYDW